MSTQRLLLTAALLIPATGCAGLGSWQDILADAAGGLYGSDVSGEIRDIDTRRQRIEIASSWGEHERLRYDNRTQVYYGQRRFDVRDLSRGDQVRVRVEDENQREPYASVITVESSYRGDRTDRGEYGRVERHDGRVDRVDTRNGWFELTIDRGTVLLVTLPYDPGRTTLDRFRRLRRGDRIRIEGERLNRERMELRRFL